MTKPSFRRAAKQNRCLVPTDGFYEWREIGGKKYPYFIFIFSFAGIWDQWLDRSTGELIHSFSILTTNANTLLARMNLKTMNGQQFQLEMGGHPNKKLQPERREYGKEVFVFEVLEVLEPKVDDYTSPKDS